MAPSPCAADVSKAKAPGFPLATSAALFPPYASDAHLDDLLTPAERALRLRVRAFAARLEIGGGSLHARRRRLVAAPVAARAGSRPRALSLLLSLSRCRPCLVLPRALRCSPARCPKRSLTRRPPPPADRRPQTNPTKQCTTGGGGGAHHRRAVGARRVPPRAAAQAGGAGAERRQREGAQRGFGGALRPPPLTLTALSRTLTPTLQTLENPPNPTSKPSPQTPPHQGHGCAGLSTTENALACLELARVDASVATFHLVHNFLALLTIGLLARPSSRHLPLFCCCFLGGGRALRARLATAGRCRLLL